MVQGAFTLAFSQPVFRIAAFRYGFSLAGAVGGLGHAPACLGGFLQFVGALERPRCRPRPFHFPVSRRQNRVSRCVPDRMGQLDGGFFLTVSSNFKRVVTFPVPGSTTRSFFLTVFFGIFAAARSARSAALSALRYGLF